MRPSGMELPIRCQRKSYRLETRNLSYKLQSPCFSDTLDWISCNKKSRKLAGRVILKDVSCEANPGEVTAIAGASGAGKTSLLEILAAATSSKNVSGEVLINGLPLHPQSFRRISGYVTQQDCLFPLLTVRETLTYSALLRLHDAKNLAVIRVQALLKELGLEHVAESRVGQGSSHGISGGERRRVSIGAELVHDPSLILIDEPTSGLDSASAFHIVSTLKLMALNQGKTIVLTIHQPGFRILQLIDRLVLLSNGCVIHNGSLQHLGELLKFSGQSIPRHVNVLEFAIEVSFFLNNQEQGLNTKHSVATRFDDEDKYISYSNTQFEEVSILAQRFCKITFRTKQLFATRIIQSMVAGFILGTIYMDIDDKKQGDIALKARLGFFAFTLTYLLSSTTEALPVFLNERRSFMNESSRGAYRVSSYVIANTLVFLPFLLLIGFVYATPTYWLVGLRPKIEGYMYFSLVVWLVILMANSFTACFSALVPNFIMGTSIIAGLMGSFFLFSGYFISKEKIPSYWKFMHYLSLFKYPFECFLINEYGGGGDNRCLTSERGVCSLYRDDFLESWGLEESQKWSNIGVMLGFIIGYRLLCFLILLVRWYIRCR